ncbi:MAG TPA: amidase family protein [Caulobacteraceae bacterium]|nr:amidase family protein [Caulobacteraceae bacterium]
MDDYSNYDGVGLAELVRSGEVKPSELIEAAVARVEQHNPAINAVVYQAFDEARAKADALPEGPFRGVPFLVKDLLIQVAGWPRTSGSRYCRGVVDAEDDGLMRRYRASGVAAIGKTNLSEFGIAGTTEGQLYGPCRNPWNLEHIVGGSSGGAAAAVASGIVPMAHGGDGRGSIRIPASCCGLVGLKPTRDRSPHLPDGYDFAQGFVVEHVITRTVRDSAVMLDVTGQPEPGSPYAAPAKDRPYAEETLRSPGKLKIAYSSETANGRPCHPEVQAALEATAELLRRLGHEVVPQGLGVDQRALWGSQGAFSGANFAAGMRRMIEEIGREPEGDDFEPLTWASWKGGQRATGMDAMADAQTLRMLGRAALQIFETYDVFLTPTLAAPPPPIGYLSPVLNAPRDIGRRNGEFFSYPGVANMTGAPSISLPLAWSSQGLPMGMMFGARYADEATLFRLAAQLEKEAPWKDKHPAIWN